LSLHRPTLRARIVLAGCLCVAAASAFAQGPAEFPLRPLRMVVPYPPGGSTDIIGRAVAAKLGENLGQQVVVDNRPGAGGNVGADAVAKAAPDGYTLLMSSVTTLAIGASNYSRPPYELSKDLEPVALVGSVPFVLLANASLPVNSVRELIALARERPGQLNFGSAGNGTSAHFAGELFKSLAAIDIVHVPYKGNAPAMTDLIGGQIQLMFDFLPSAMPFIKSGKVKALAITPGKRSAALPDVPTLAEAGVPAYDMLSYFGVLAPAKTPPHVVARLNAEINRVSSLPDVRERFAREGIDPARETPEQFRAYLQTEVAKWSKMVKDTGLRAE
jgi:tripartite-type tricarboxylate transporter receptor subunit TctC